MSARLRLPSLRTARMDFSSHRTQLASAAVVASLTTAGAMSAWRAYSRRVKRRTLDADILRSISRGESETGSKSPSLHAPSPPSSQGYDEDLIREQLARNYAFFGEEGMAKVRGASLAVIGCGGVGSWAAVMLVRSSALVVLSSSSSPLLRVHIPQIRPSNTNQPAIIYPSIASHRITSRTFLLKAEREERA